MANEGRRIPVTLDFKSDTTQMNKDLDRLEQKLRSIGQGQGILGGDQAVTKEMNTAMNAASKLSSILQKCRLDNGKLNVASFKRELENAGYTAQSLATELAALGPTGVQTFNNISKAVMNSEVSVRKTQGMMAELALTLKNTAKWQISSSLLHGFMSSVSHAYNYAQDLNSSLNNIRIITKQNADEMANFAKQANEAAKGLSVSTTAYTDAALIFYQQGLKGEDVTSRTDVVAKMSNVTKDSVADVSSYMTAIWNNFDDGSQSLEHYADVITGLGAATASSSAEIAQGLEKFAAVSDTVGLSYDYATSALATVVAQTRQSADTVGTAFKTLFARIEGLKLGETLEDGVDLNKYSEALAKIGVNVLDANGQLRDMDSILDDMGAKWGQINKAQQVALAQTVAGTRQYNQLVALMDNWDKVQENLQVARSSDEELQAQADVYAKSWEAAKKRVETAAQVIYKNLMDEDFFIKLANGAEKFLTILGKIIEDLGGLKGLWPVLLAGMTKLFSGDIGLNIGNQIAGFKDAIDQAAGVFQQFKDNFGEAVVNIHAKVDDEGMMEAMTHYKTIMQELSQVREGVDVKDTVTKNELNDMELVIGAGLKEYAAAKNALKEATADFDQKIDENVKLLADSAKGNIDTANERIAEIEKQIAEETKKAEEAKAEASTESTAVVAKAKKQVQEAVQEEASAIKDAGDTSKEGYEKIAEAAEDTAKRVEKAAETISLHGKKIAFTGKFDGYTSRTLLADSLKNNYGAEIVGNPKSGLKNEQIDKADYILAGSPTKGHEKSYQKKLDYAQEQGKTVISQDELPQILATQQQIKQETEETAQIEATKAETLNAEVSTEQAQAEAVKTNLDQTQESAELNKTETAIEEEQLKIDEQEIQAQAEITAQVNETIAALERERDTQREIIEQNKEILANKTDIQSYAHDAYDATPQAMYDAMGGDALSGKTIKTSEIQGYIDKATQIYNDSGKLGGFLSLDEGLLTSLQKAIELEDNNIEKFHQIRDILQDIIDVQKEMRVTVEETANEVTSGTNAFDGMGKATEAVGDAATDVAEKMTTVKNNSAAVREELSKIRAGVEGSIDPVKQFADSFSKTAMNGARFATVLTQIDNLYDQMATKDPGEWMKSLIAILPMVIFNLKASWGFIQSIHSGLTAILSGEVKQSIVKAVNLKLTQKQAAAQAQIVKDEAIETANDVAQSGAKAAGNAAGTAGAGAGAAGATTGAAAAGEGAGTSGMLAALGGSAAAVAASVVLIVGALAGVAAYIVHKVNMQNLKKEAEKAAAKETKQAEKIEEVTAELDAIDQLAEGYDNLKANMDSMTREQAKAQAIQLAAQYQDESLMILALTESYKELEAQIKKTQAARQEEANKELETGIEYNKDNILAQAQQAAGSAKDDLGNEWDLGHGNGEYTRIAIENLLGKQNYQFEAGTKMLKEDWESMWEKATTDPEAFKKFQQEVVDAAARGENAAIHLKEYIDAASESIKAAADNVNKLKQLKLETAFNEIYNGFKGAIDGADDFFDFIAQVKAKDSEASDSDIIHMASTYANTQDSAIYGETALSVADQQGWDLKIEEDKQKFDNLIEDLKKYDKDTVAVLGVQVNITGSIVDKNGHINLKEAGLTEDQLKTLGGVQHEKSEINKIQGAMSKFDPTKAAKGDAWSKKDRAEMGDIEGLNLNASDEDILEQLRKLEQDHIKTLEDKKKAADELTEAMAKLADSEEIRYHNLEGYGKIDLKNETEESMQQKADEVIRHQLSDRATTNDFRADFNSKKITTSELTGEDLKQSLVEAEEQGKSLKDQLVLIAEYYADKLPDNAKKFDEEIKKVYADLNIKENENKDLIKNSIKLRKDATNAVKKYNQQTKISEDVIAALNSEIEAQSESLETLQNRVIAANQSMDNMQTAYKSLKGIEAQYAEDHFLTVDSFQEILNMEPQYLSALEFENGQLKINEGTLQEVAIARVRNMEAEQAELMMKELDIIATGEEESVERQGLLTKYASIAANQVAGFTMEAVAAKARELAAANNELAGTYNNVAAAASNYAAAANATIKGLQTNFPKAMGYTPKGGGGSKKSKETKDLKEYADEFDRFYPFQKVIDDLADAISDLAKEQEHLAGGELVGSIRYQNKLLQDQKKAYQELAKEQKKYQKEMQADLAKYGMSFDTASGNIVNYAQSTQAMLDRYNAAIEKYNKSAQSDADKKTLEAVEKEYEKFKKLVSNYQGILTEIQDTENNLDDIYYETIANNLKEFEIMVQVKLDIGEARRMVNDFINEINKNFKTLRKTTEEWMSIFDNALKNAHTYIDGDLGTINVDLDALNKVKSAIDSGDYGHEGAMFVSETEAITKYKELAEQLKDDSEELYDLYKEAWEDYLDAVDDAIEQWEEIIDNFDDINDTLDHYEKVIELLHGTDSDESLQLLSQLYQQQVELSIAKQATLRKEIETLDKEYQELIASGAHENDEDVKKIKEAIKNANKELQSTIESYIDTIQKELENSITIANNIRQKSIWGDEIDKIKEDWDLAKKASEGYYDSVQKVYQIDKLNDGYKKLINDTKSLKTKKLLAEFQEKEIDNLQSINKLTEKDVEIAQKKLELKQMEIALQEAQDNKSQMRLQRDSQGNWSYQFVADENDIEDRFQAIEDKANEIRDLTIQATKEATETAMEYEIEFYTKVTELAVKYKDDKAKFEEEYKKLVEIYYGENGLIPLKVEESERYKRETNKATIELLFALYEDDVSNYDRMTEDEKALIDDLKKKDINSFDDMLKHNIDTYDKNDKKANEVNQNTIKYWQTMAANAMKSMTDIQTHTNQCYMDITAALEEYDRAVQRSEETSGIAWSNVQQAIEYTGYSIDEVSNKIDECVEHSQALSDFRERVNDLESAWLGVRQSIIDALGSLDDYMQRLLEVREMQEEVKRNETEATGSAEIDIATGEPMGKGGGTPYSPSYTTPKSTFSYNMYGSTGTTWTNNQTKKEVSAPNLGRNFGAAKVSGVAAGAKQLSTPIVVNNVATSSKASSSTYNVGDNPYREDTWAYKLREKLFGSRFASGGYTGEWGSDPRLALLDQKELVLNASDTSKILDTVKIVRDMNSSNNEFISYLADIINQSTDALAQAMESGINILGERMAYTSDRVASALLDAGSRQLEQNVHIDASFPNVQNSREIEDAFNNLVNIASQRALASDVLISDSYLI